MSALKYWIWLAECGQSQGESLGLLLNHFGSPEAAYFAEDGDYSELTRLSTTVRSRLREKSLVQVERILDDCDRLNLRILTMGDGDYPERLKQIDDPPAVLYAKGKMRHFDDEIAVGMVGARKATPYGLRTATALAMDFTRHGGLVVSGIAQGIDTACVQGALKGGGTPVVVVAGGVDVPYPKQNTFLYKDVAAAGLILSEAPPGTTNEAWRFPLRNRIISGLSLGVLAVECQMQSGTMITMRRALEQNRDIFAVPGNVDSPMSTGTNSLLREGATPIIQGIQLVEEYADRFPGRVRTPAPLTQEGRAQRMEPVDIEGQPEPQPKAEPTQPTPPPLPLINLNDPALHLTEDQQIILKAMETEIYTADDLVERTQLPTRRVLSALTMLQVMQLVAEEPGRRYRTLVRLK